jgi:protein-disulfide isomerase
MKQKTLLIASGAFFALAFIGGALVYNAQRSDEAARAAERNRSHLVRMHSPSLGKPDAKVHIVEFLDPACGTCRAFYPFVKKLMADNPDKVKLSLRYAPFHSNSDIVVKMLEAARKQGKFWEALEAVLASQDLWAPNHQPQPQLVWNFLGGIGLNFEQLRRDMDTPEIAALIAQDVADARALDVKMTPEFFVNGRPMPSFGYEQLQGLVDTAIADAYR